MRFSTTLLIASTVLAATIGLANAQGSPGILVPADGGTPGLPPGDHYLCYMVQKKIAPLSVTLKDQFGSYQARVIAVTRLCNPVQKMFQGKVTEVRNRELHYVCYRVETNRVNRMVMVRNQFGVNRFQVTGPNELCLPSQKKVIGPNGGTDPTGGQPTPGGAPVNPAGGMFTPRGQ